MIVVVGLPAYTDDADGERCAGGLAVEIAAEASRRGAVVELAGKVGADGAGDSVVLALGRMGVGHAALLRDPALPTPLLVATNETLDADDDASDDMTSHENASKHETRDGAASNVAVGPEDEVAVPPVYVLPDDPNARPALEAGDVEMALRYLTGASVVVVAEQLAAPALAAAVEGAAFSGAKLVVLAGEGTASVAGLPETATVLQAPSADDGAFARLVGAYAAALDGGDDPAKAFRDGVTAVGWELSAD